MWRFDGLTLRPFHDWFMVQMSYQIAFKLITLLIVLSTTSAVPAAGTAPDLSNPKAAAKSLYHAVAAGDAAAVRQVLLTEGEAQEQLAGAFADVLTAGKKLNDAARDKFGAAGDAIGKPTITEEDAARVDQAVVTPTGKHGDDEVRLEIAGQAKPMVWRKGTDGQWRLVVMDFAGADPQKLPEQISMLAGVSQAMSDTADDIAAGKFAAAADAEASLQQRLNEVMIKIARAAAAIGATSRPGATTGPATAPTGG